MSEYLNNRYQFSVARYGYSSWYKRWQRKLVKSNVQLLRDFYTENYHSTAYSREVNGVSIQIFAVKHRLKQCAELWLDSVDKQGLVHAHFITWPEHKSCSSSWMKHLIRLTPGHGSIELFTLEKTLKISPAANQKPCYKYKSNYLNFTVSCRKRKGITFPDAAEMHKPRIISDSKTMKEISRNTCNPAGV